MRVYTTAIMLLGMSCADAQTARQMQTYCQSLDIRTSEEANKPLMIPNTLEAGMCWGAFSTFSAAAMFLRKDDGRRLLGICSSPKSTTVPQFIETFLRAAENHPEASQEEFGPVALKALQDAFPCPK